MHDVHVDDSNIKIAGGKIDGSDEDTLPKDEEAEALEL